MVLRIARIHALELTEHLVDRIAHALRRPPADGEVGLNVLKRQPAARRLKPYGGRTMFFKRSYRIVEFSTFHSPGRAVTIPGERQQRNFSGMAPQSPTPTA